MFKQKAILIILMALSASGCVAAQPAESPLPNFAVVPVEQDAPWAVEWWRDRHDAKLEAAKHTEVDLLFVGDSITHGWEDVGAAVWQVVRARYPALYWRSRYGNPVTPWYFQQADSSNRSGQWVVFTIGIGDPAQREGCVADALARNSGWVKQ